MVLCLFILGLLHYHYALPPPNCLTNRTGNWSGDGILRVEVKYKRSWERAAAGCTDNTTVDAPADDQLSQPGLEGHNESMYGPFLSHRQQQWEDARNDGNGLAFSAESLKKKKKPKRRKGSIRSVLPWSLAILAKAYDEEADNNGPGDELASGNVVAVLMSLGLLLRVK